MNNLDGIENGAGRLGSFKSSEAKVIMKCVWVLSYQEQQKDTILDKLILFCLSLIYSAFKHFLIYDESYLTIIL